MIRRVAIVAVAMLWFDAGLTKEPVAARPERSLDDIAANDNRRTSGVLRDGVLTIHLTAAAGTWFPETKDGPGRRAYAFGETGRGLTSPGPGPMPRMEPMRELRQRPGLCDVIVHARDQNVLERDHAALLFLIIFASGH